MVRRVELMVKMDIDTDDQPGCDTVDDVVEQLMRSLRYDITYVDGVPGDDTVEIQSYSWKIVEGE